jgi:hypothetical protein
VTSCAGRQLLIWLALIAAIGCWSQICLPRKPYKSSGRWRDGQNPRSYGVRRLSSSARASSAPAKSLFAFGLVTLVTLLVASTAAPARADLITNGDFQDPTAFLVGNSFTEGVNLLDSWYASGWVNALEPSTTTGSPRTPRAAGPVCFR